MWPKTKEYEIKTKMEQEQWLQLRMLFLLGYNLKIVVWWGREGIDFWLGGSFLGGVEWANFQLVGGLLFSPHPLVGKTLYGLGKFVGPYVFMFFHQT